MTREERAWIRAAQAGSAPDLEVLFRTHWTAAYRAAYLTTQDRLSAQEVAQEVFLAAVRALHRFGRDRPFGPWLYRTVVTRSIDAARGRVSRSGAAREAPLHVPDPLGWSQPVLDPSAEDEALGIAHGLSLLSPEQRAGIVLRYEFEYAPQEIAEILDLPKSTVNARLRRDRDHLEARLSPGTPISAHDLQGYLFSIPLPDERAAEERAWEVVRTAFAAREPASGRRRLKLRWLAFALVVAGGVAIALTPARDTIWDWAQDVAGQAEPATTGPPPLETGSPLPAPGQLLVAAGGGVAVVEQDGTWRELGSYEGATWSPDGTFVTAWTTRRLDALDSTGRGGVQWSIEHRAIADAAWSASGFRVAYLSGRMLRVVGANGTEDRRLARPVGEVAPAWRPGEQELLAYADPKGRVILVDAETAEQQSRIQASQAVVALGWTADGRRLAVLGQRELRLYDFPGKLRATVPFDDDSSGTGLAPRPGADELAYAVYSALSGRSSVYLVAGRSGASQLLFAGTGRLETLVWSPDGDYLLLAWRAADQWLFIPPSRTRPVTVKAAVSDLGGGAGYPEPLGWCCVEG
jgi:RNA polymerase sigma-70 factor (ECF subfamily)